MRETSLGCKVLCTWHVELLTLQGKQPSNNIHFIQTPARMLILGPSVLWMLKEERKHKETTQIPETALSISFDIYVYLSSDFPTSPKMGFQDKQSIRAGQRGVVTQERVPCPSKPAASISNSYLILKVWKMV